MEHLNHRKLTKIWKITKFKVFLQPGLGTLGLLFLYQPPVLSMVVTKKITQSILTCHRGGTGSKSQQFSQKHRKSMNFVVFSTFFQVDPTGWKHITWWNCPSNSIWNLLLMYFTETNTILGYGTETWLQNRFLWILRFPNLIKISQNQLIHNRVSL